MCDSLPRVPDFWKISLAGFPENCMKNKWFANTLFALASLPAFYMSSVSAAQDRIEGTLPLRLPETFRQPPQPNLEAGRAIAVGAYTLGPEGACFRCHGIDGAGDSTAGFPRITDQSVRYMVATLQAYASGARPSDVMQPIARELSVEEMRNVSAYYASIKDAPYPPPPSVEPDVLQIGAMLSAIGAPEQGVQACMNCHGPEGVGLPPTYPFIGGQYAVYLERELRLYAEGKRRSDELAIMRYLAGLMTDDQITAAALYFASLRPPGVTPEGGVQPVAVAAPPAIMPIPEDIPGVE
jgi:cytochrome c553